MANVNDAIRANLLESTYLGTINVVSRLLSAKTGITSFDIPVLPISAPEALEQGMQSQSLKRQDTQEPYKLPVAGVSLQSINPRVNGFNATALRRVGQSLGIDDSGQHHIVFKGVPKSVTFQVTFLTDDMGVLLRMVDTWSSWTQWRFEVRMRDTGKGIRVQLAPDGDISVPPKAANSAGSDRYTLTTNLTADTYSGYLWKIPTAAKLDLDYIVTRHDADISESLATANIAVNQVILFPNSNTEVGIEIG